MLETFLAASVFDQDPAHRLRGRGEEVGAAVPLRLGIFADEPEIGLVHQIGRLEGLPRGLASEPLGGQLAQFLVDQGQELLGCLQVALLDRREDLRDVVHRKESPERNNPAASTRPRAPSLGSSRSPGRADGVAPQTNTHESEEVGASGRRDPPRWAS